MWMGTFFLLNYPKLKVDGDNALKAYNCKLLGCTKVYLSTYPQPLTVHIVYYKKEKYVYILREEKSVELRFDYFIIFF